METKYADYKTLREAADEWGVTRRYVNLCVENGRIPGALMLGNMWLIPKSAGKPAAKRGGSPQKSMSPSSRLLYPDLAKLVEATTLPMPIGNPDAILSDIREERVRLHYESELAYLRGDFERVVCCYRRTDGDDESKLRASSIAIAAVISMGDYPLYMEVETFLKSIIETTADDRLSAFAELCLANGSVGTAALNMVPEWLKAGDFSALPPQARPDASYKRAKYFQYSGQYESMFAVAQTALELGSSKDSTSLHDIYFRVLCVIACCVLERRDEAERRMLEVMGIALPLGLVTPFAESLTAFGGLLEQCLEREYPEYLDAIIKQWEGTFTNWLIFRNRFNKDNITLILARRDYQIAQMVAWDVPYKKIAEQFHMSVGTVTNRMQIVYETLCISGKNRKNELMKYIW